MSRCLDSAICVVLWAALFISTTAHAALEVQLNEPAYLTADQVSGSVEARVLINALLPDYNKADITFDLEEVALDRGYSEGLEIVISNTGLNDLNNPSIVVSLPNSIGFSLEDSPAYTVSQLPNGDWEIILKNPILVGQSVSLNATLSASPDAQIGVESISFTLNANGAVITEERLQIKINNVVSGLFLTNDVDRAVVYHDEVVTYRLSVSSQYEVGTINNVTISDFLPVGMRFMGGTVKRGGTADQDPVIAQNGRDLTFNIGTIGPEETMVIEYIAYVTAAAPEGKSISPASAQGDGASSNDARAITVVKADPINTESHVVGRVMANACEVTPNHLGLLGMQLSSELVQDHLRYRMTFQTEGVDLQKFNALLDVPATLNIDANSVQLNGQPFSGLKEKAGQYIFDLGTVPGNGRYQLQFDGQPETGHYGEFEVMAMASYHLEGLGFRRTELLSNTYRHQTRDQKIERYSLWPRFESFSAELGEEDQQHFDQILSQVDKQRVQRITVIGHADTRPIRARSQSIYADNQALSLARANVAAEYARQRLGLEADKVDVLGKGDSFPLLKGRSGEDNAANRRVEIVIESLQQASKSQTQVLKAVADTERKDIFGEQLVPLKNSLNRKADGLQGIRLIMEDGRFVETDAEGRYHFEAIKPGTHVVQIDPDSIPEGFEPYLCESNTRFAQNPSSRFIEVSNGLIWRANFHLRPKAQEKRELALQMKAQRQDDTLNYTVSVDDAQQAGWLHIDLAEALTLDMQSLRVDGREVQPEQQGQQVKVPLAQREGEYSVNFRAAINENAKGDLRSRAWLAMAEYESAPVDTILSIQPEAKTQERYPFDLPFAAEQSTLTGAADIQVRDIVALLEGQSVHQFELAVSADSESLAQARADAIRTRLSNAFQQASWDVTVEKGSERNRVVAHVGDADAKWQTTLTKPESAALKETVTIDQAKEMIEAQQEAAPEPKQDGILNITEGQKIADNSSAVRIQLDARLKLELWRDDQLIPAEKVGFQSVDRKTNKALYTFFGVDLGERGNHELTVKGIGPFGNARFEQIVPYVRTGEIDKIELVAAEGNVADGKTPVRAKLKLLDKQGDAVNTALGLQVVEGQLRPYEETQEEGIDFLEDSDKLLEVNKDGTVAFEPVSQAGLYRVTLKYNDVEEDIKIQVKPHYRDWVMVGLADATFGYNDLSGNVEELSANDIEDEYYDEGKVAFYAKGKIKGKYLLTVAFDSSKERQEDERLMQLINPEDYYTLYGDNTEQGFDAASREKLYIRFDADRFYAMFGDFNTEMTQTELSRYSRSFTGARAVYESERFSVNSFAAETLESYQRDEIRGNGTSGLYQLSRGNIVANSEKIRIEVRDRFNPQEVISEETLSRFSDYYLDYQDGSLYFKKPVAANADGFNPVFIVAEYETRNLSEEDIVAGGRAAVKFNDEKIELGVSAVHENITGADGQLVGTDARVEISDNMEVRAEYATTDVEANNLTAKGDAYRAEWVRDGEVADVQVFVREEEAAFGLGQQSQIGQGTRRYGAATEITVDERWSVDSEISHEDNLQTSAESDLVRAQAEYEQDQWSLRGGATLAQDKDQLDRKHRSELLNFGASRLLVDDRLELRADTEWQLNDDEGANHYPNRHIVGADYALTSAVDVFTEHEWTHSDLLETRANRAGLRARPWSNAVLNSSLERNTGEFDERTFAVYGLTQTIPLNARWKASFSYDESRTLKQNTYPAVNPNAPLPSGSAMPQTEDFWAATSGVGYQSGLYLFDSRLEYRDSRSDTRTGVFASWQRDLERGVGHALRLQLFDTELDKGGETVDGELRYSTVIRPIGSRWMWFNRLEYKHKEDDTAASGTQSRKIVENLAINYTPSYRWQLAAHLGLKRVRTELAGGDIDNDSWLLGTETRFDLNEHWDIGAQYHYLGVDNFGLSQESWGLSTGFDLAKNLWLSIGYNWEGYDDEDFRFNGYTAEGPYLKLRYKFDQNTFKLREDDQ
ncbi:OmpA family protein [gamma proteobacterium HTCC5015]|nr:OmpA family protein [gamma proteobacterium HTCC5015]